MKVGGSHLSYCTNIHPGESWDQIRGNLERFLPLVKRQVSPNVPLGVGLRLSAAAARSLAEPAALERFAAFLRDEDLYVFTINGFPYGTFHGTRVKEDVYLPDWRDTRRLAYTNQLADLLAGWIPSGPDAVGSISTVPGAFKPNAVTDAAIHRIVEGLLQHTAHLVGIERATGKQIVLALEPEPCCLLETVAETVAFFHEHLYSNAAVARLVTLTGLTPTEAQRALRRHLGVCLDLCHAAVEFEDPEECLRSLAVAEVPVAKMQVTAGLRISPMSEAAAESLRGLVDDVYLHQVVERRGEQLTRYVDIEDALASSAWRAGGSEWRVHFHVPVFLDHFEQFSSTQAFVREALARHRHAPVTRHLEVETYTWSVLPPMHRTAPVEDAIARELNWVRGELA